MKLGGNDANQKGAIKMENLKKVLALVVEMGNVGDRVGRTKNWMELMSLTDEVMALPGVNWAELVEEAKTPDVPVLVSFVKEKLDLVDDDLEHKVETTVAAIGSLGSAVLTWVRVESE